MIKESPRFRREMEKMRAALLFPANLLYQTEDGKVVARGIIKEDGEIPELRAARDGNICYATIVSRKDTKVFITLDVGVDYGDIRLLSNVVNKGDRVFAISLRTNP